MNDKHITDIIFINYYDFLELYGKINACNYTDLDFCKSITNNKTTWPNFLFDIKILTKKNVKTIIKSIENKEIADVLLTNNNIAQNDSILINNNFKKVAIWNAMALDLSEYKQTVVDYKLDIKIVKSEQQIIDWISIVRQELKINFSINEVINLTNEDSINLYIGYYNGIAVSTALTYTNKYTTGHYMIATLKDYTKNGFGFEIMQFSLNYSNDKIAVLASTPQGISLYTKLNYRKIDSFNVYWKLPN